VIYPSYLYNYGEFFARTVATLHAAQAKGWIGKRCVIGGVGARVRRGGGAVAALRGSVCRGGDCGGGIDRGSSQLAACRGCTHKATEQP
jgi:hypothetical protein